MMAQSAAAAHRNLWQEMQQITRALKPGFESVAQATYLLKTLLHDAGTLPLGTLVRKIILATSYDAVLMGAANGRRRSRNLWKIAAMAAEKEDMSALQFAESLRLMREFNVKQSDAPVDTGNSVKLMTIHGSKGLEFGAVALPVLSTPVRGR